MANPFVHVELHSGDTKRAQEFYSGLFSWKLEDVPMGELNYTMIQVGDGTGGGIAPKQAPGAPSQWVAYVQVDDVENSTKQAEKLGGNVIVGVTEVPGMGSFSIIADPEGAVFGLWEAKTG